VTEALRHAILRYGSDTPDNIEAIQHLAIQEGDFGKGVGTTSGLLASSIVNRKERVVRKQYSLISEKIAL